MPLLNDYLKKLLYQYDCVVVPELGAFLTHYQSASFSKTTGQYLPPRKRVAFNEALRLDDGILLNYIMLHEGVGREQAQRQVSQFVNEMRRQVVTQGRFDLDNIGSFSQNDEGRLQFEPGLRHNFFDEAYGMSAIAATALDRHLQTERALDAVPVTALGPVLMRDEDVTYLPMRRRSRQRRGRQRYGAAWRVAAAILLVSFLGLVSYFSVLDPGQPFQSGVDPASMLRLPKSWLERVSSNGATSFTEKAVSVPKPIEEPVSPVETTVPKAVAVPAPVVVATPVPVTNKAVATAPKTVATAAVVSEPAAAPMVAKPKINSPFFTVIAGSFASKANAYKLRRTLRKAGYGDAFIIPPTTGKQLYKVAASGSISVDEAMMSADTISALVSAKAWIMRN